jgi:hypothetical protein
MAERAWFRLCLVLGALLRAGRYASVRIVDRDGKRHVHKRRSFCAPLLVWLGGPLVRMLHTGGRVLPQREWEERERLLYQHVHARSISIAADGTLVLPHLPGRTLASLLEDPALEATARRRAIEMSVVALADFHRLGFTHGDAMAENVMVDVDAGVARWFDFETVHDASRSMAWRRADDVRALLATCVLRTAPEHFAGTIDYILDVYADEDVARLVAASFRSVWRRALVFHLGQAPLSIQVFRQIDRSLRERAAL